MNIDNVERASCMKRELSSIDNAVASAQKLVDDAEENSCGFLITQYSDGSGIEVGYIYKDGCHPKQLYLNIAKAVLAELKKHQEALLEEVKTL